MYDFQQKFGPRDFIEIAVGAVALAFPIAVTEEVWNLSKELPARNIVWIALCSIFFIACFVFAVIHEGSLKNKKLAFVARVATVYLTTLVVVALILASIDRLEFDVDAAVAIKRMVIVALPASFSATVVDSLR